MTGRCHNTDSNRRRKAHGARAPMVALVGMLFVVVSAAAQDAGAPAVQPPNPNYQPGFLDALGRWFGDSKARIDEQFKTTTDAARDAAGAAGQATGVIVALPGTRVVIGRQRCALAPNGAPDCAPAATALCRSKGFGAGKSIDINSAQKCPASVWISGRSPAEGECRTETFVTRAVCQ